MNNSEVKVTFGKGMQDPKLANQIEALAASGFEIAGQTRKGNHATLVRSLDNRSIYVSKQAYLASANEAPDVKAFVKDGKPASASELKEGEEVILNAEGITMAIEEGEIILAEA